MWIEAICTTGTADRLCFPIPPQFHCDLIAFLSLQSVQTSAKQKKNGSKIGGVFVCLLLLFFFFFTVLSIFLHFLLQRPEEAEFCCCAWEHGRAWGIL